MDEIKNPFLSQEEGNDNLKSFLDDEATNLPPENETPQQKLLRLQKREEELLQRQEELQQAKSQVYDEPNWPRFFPVFHIDINNEIPVLAQRLVKVALYNVVFTVIQSFINIISSVSISGLSNYSYPRSFVFALIFTALQLYLTISICFPRLYRGCKNHNIPISFTFLQFILIGFTLYLLVGFPNSGSVGLATFLDLIAKSDSVWSKIISFVNTFFIFFCVLLHVYVLQQSQSYQKVSGVQDLPAP
ncbi:secretory carrier-associated membrane protein 2-like [Histomonas meleagridis]|uniref:secretory carrier-associated membrane protein 2-like n=1 Tax=Histomonas meleagridis TaxID=135588 RepID=UPI00355943DE|nr:secretory carrier-associated membrane protein 2-like [Histomonas meleagridis]KAH0797568.1 secretory carrier-associated membrane protein 2-like [Histomonas meleagridis]